MIKTTSRQRIVHLLWDYSVEINVCDSESPVSRRDHLTFDGSLARQYTWDRFRINEQTCQVDTLAWFSWYMAVIARWGMASWNSSEVSLTMRPTMGWSTRKERKVIRTISLYRYPLRPFSSPARSPETWFHDAVFYDSSTELSPVNALIIRWNNGCTSFLSSPETSLVSGQVQRTRHLVPSSYQ